MTSSIRVLSTADRTWQIQDGDNLPRDLPAWLWLYCCLNHSFIFASVALCISLGGLGFNLICGNPVKDWIVPFGVFFPAIFLIVGNMGVTEARQLLFSLRYGLLAQAVITHCCPATKPRSSFQIGSGEGGWQVRIPLEKATPAPQEIPVAEYVQRIRDQHLARFDAQGAYIGTKAERLVTLAHAVILGAVLGLILGLVSGLPLNMILLIVLAAAIACGVVEARKRFWLRLTAGQRLEGNPLGSRDVTCRLELTEAAHAPSPFFAVLDLAGDEQDYAPKYVLLESNFPEPLFPSKIPIPNTLDESAARLSFKETGLRARLILALVAGLTAATVCLGAM